MSAPLGAILCGLLGSTAAPPVQPITQLDVASGPSANPTLSIDVGANDAPSGSIANPAITSGPGGGSVAVVSNQIVLTHGGAGIYVITYDNTIGALTDQGTATAVITPPAGSGIAPSAATPNQFVNTGNLAGFSMPVTTPPNARGVFFSISTWLGFLAGEPQTVTVTADYDGTPMARVDTFGNQIFTGDPNSPTATGPAIYSFLLLAPGDTIPASGNINWNFAVTGGGDVEVHEAFAFFPTHPSRDLLFSELGKVRTTTGVATSVNVPATAADGSLLINLTSFKGQGTLTGDVSWPTSDLIIANGTSALVSGRLLAQTRTFSTGGNADHTTSTNAADLYSSATYQFSDPLGGGGGGTAPTAEPDLTASAVTGGSQISVDMSGAGGTPAGAITAVDLRSGGGVASFSGQDLLFTPPATDGVSVVDVAYANTAGAVISTVTITSSTVTFGPTSGPAVGIGHTGTTALGPIITNLVDTIVRPALVAAHDRGMTDAEIRTANPGFTDLLGTSGADLSAELSGGNRDLILRNDRQYDWSDLGNNQNTPTAGMQLVGLNGANVIVGGGNKNAGARRWQIRGDVRLEGIDFRDGGLLLSAVGLAATVNTVSIRHCKSNNLANFCHHELDTQPSNSLVINNLIFRNNICTDVRDGLNMRLSNGQSFNQGTVVNADIQDNIIDGWQRFAIALHFDTPPVNFAYNANSYALVRGNLIQNAVTATQNGFGIATAAFKDHDVDLNWGVNNSRGGTGFDHEILYSKGESGRWTNNVFSQSGQNAFQGVIGLKAEDGVTGDNAGVLEVRNNLIFSDQGDTDGLIFVQRDNANIHHNVLVAGSDCTVMTTQSSIPLSGLQFEDNLIRDNSNAPFSAIGIGGDNAGYTFARNVWEFHNASGRAAYRFRSSTAGGRDLENMAVDGDTFKAIGAGNYLAFQLEERTGQVINPSFNACAFENWPRALEVTGGDIDATVTWTNHTHTGTAPTVSNTSPSTISTLGAGGGNSF